MQNDIVIVSMARTAFGAFLGSLQSLSAHELAGEAIASAVKKSGISQKEVSQVIMGHVLSAGCGQAAVRQAAIHAGLDVSVGTASVNKVCGSGMFAIQHAVYHLQAESKDVVIAGGMESMSQAPYLIQGARNGLKFGNQKLIDSMVHDGLTNPYDLKHMGQCAEKCAEKYSITREEQDRYAMESFSRAQRAQSKGLYDEQITPINIKVKKDVVTIDKDEGPSKINFDKVPHLKPCFEKEGTITAANASTLNDGACALALMTREEANKRGLKPLAKIASIASHAREPVWFTVAPVGAIQKAMQKANWDSKNVDLFEVNEAFAVVPLAAQKELGIPHEKLNVHGGAIALGHPIGASGARIVMQLVASLKFQNKQKGVASICIGGGEAMAMCIENEG